MKIHLLILLGMVFAAIAMVLTKPFTFEWAYTVSLIITGGFVIDRLRDMRKHLQANSTLF